MENTTVLTPDEFNGHVTFDGALYILGISKKKFRELVRNGLPVGSRVHDSSIFWGTEGKFSYFNVGNIVNFYGENLPQEEKDAIVHRAKLASKIDSGFVVKVLGDGKERTLRFYRVIEDGSEGAVAPSETEGGSDAPQSPAPDERTLDEKYKEAMDPLYQSDPEKWQNLKIYYAAYREHKGNATLAEQFNMSERQVTRRVDSGKDAAEGLGLPPLPTPSKRQKRYGRR